MNDLLSFTLFGSGIAFGIMLVVLFIVLITSDLQEFGWLAFISVLIFLGLNYFWGNFPVLSFLTFRNIAAYLFIGFIFSLIRTYFKGKELSIDQKKYFELKDHVYRWWLLFPISAINWIFGHLLKDLYNFVYNKIGSVYRALFNM